MNALVVDVVGLPAPQGSKRTFVVNGHAVMTESSKKVKPWRQDVVAAVLNTIAEQPGFEPFTGPVCVQLLLLMPRPRYHFRTGKRANELRPNAPTWVDKRPDVDKCTRSTCDALTTARAYLDDSQVARLLVEQRYADGPTGAHIEITPLTAVPAAPSQPTATSTPAAGAPPAAGAAPTPDGGLF